MYAYSSHFTFEDVPQHLRISSGISLCSTRTNYGVSIGVSRKWSLISKHANLDPLWASEITLLRSVFVSNRLAAGELASSSCLNRSPLTAIRTRHYSYFSTQLSQKKLACVTFFSLDTSCLRTKTIVSVPSMPLLFPFTTHTQSTLKICSQFFSLSTVQQKIYSCFVIRQCIFDL